MHVCDVVYLLSVSAISHHVGRVQVKTCVKRQAKPISCPNRCGLRFTGSYDRVRDIEFEVAEHAREACPLRVVHCDFNGCYDSMTAKDRRDHRLKHLRG